MESLPNTLHIPAVHMLTKITVTVQHLLQKTNSYAPIELRGRTKSRQGRSNEDLKRRSSAPEKVDLSSVCSECCHSCVCFSRTQVTSRGASGPAGKTQRKEKVSASTKNLLQDRQQFVG